MQFAEALERGLVPEFGTPDRDIETFISRLFFFGDKVVKVYKYEPFFFADLKTFSSRKEFILEDFFWNNTAAPEIYRHLWGVAKRGETFTLVPVGEGEDFAIEMSRIDANTSLTNLLLEGALTGEKAKLFIGALFDILETLTRERRQRLDHLFQKGLYAIMEEDIRSLHTWLLTAPDYISKDEAAPIQNTLLQALARESYFKEVGIESLFASIDNNSDNLLLLEGRPSFIDIMPPMVVWRVVDEYATLARTIVDIEVLGGPALGKAARDAYMAQTKTVLPLRARLMHEIRGASIQWSLRHVLHQHDTARKFGAFVKEKTKELQELL